MPTSLQIDSFPEVSRAFDVMLRMHAKDMAVVHATGAVVLLVAICYCIYLHCRLRKLEAQKSVLYEKSSDGVSVR